MAKRRIIPKLQFLGSRDNPDDFVLVTTVNFEKIVEMGNPISQAKIFQAQMADELIFIDLSVYKGEYQRSASLEILDKAARNIFLPLTIGGGVSSVEDIRLFLQHGADKVAINSKIIDNPDLLRKASLKFGASTVVASIDYRVELDGQRYVYSQAGQSKHDFSPAEWAIECEKLGAGEILLTCINNDGSRQGLDIPAIREVSDAVNIPVIAAGGCGLARHFSEGFTEGNADAVSAGTFFCFQDQNIMQTRSHVYNAGVDVRIRT